MLAGREIFFIVNILWLISNAALTYRNWRRERSDYKWFSERNAEIERMRISTLQMYQDAKELQFKVCPTCERIIQGVCEKCHPVLSNQK